MVGKPVTFQALHSGPLVEPCQELRQLTPSFFARAR